MRRLIVALFVLGACTTSSAPIARVSPSPSQVATPPSATPSPQPTPVASPVLGVFYDAQAAKLEVVDSNGNVVTAVTTTAPHRYNHGLQWTSASTTRVYFLDGAGAVHFLTADGTTGVATHVKLAAGQEAGFSVSPDNRRIAVALLGYRSASSFAGMRMYVEDLAGGAHHADIYGSSVNAEFPVAWTKGSLIVALSTPYCCRPGVLNPYGAVEYHVVDPASGSRLATVCHGTRGPVGPPTTVGVECLSAQDNSPQHFGWDGAPCCCVGTAGDGPLAPDGNAQAFDSPAQIEISYCPGSSNLGRIDVTGTDGHVEAWFDLTHLVYRLKADSALHIGLIPVLGGPRVPGGAGSTAYLGAFPTGIS